MSDIEVSQLFIYPAKSMGHIVLDVSNVDRFGLHNDRRWMLVDDDGIYITQRKNPRMCLINTSLNNGLLELQAPGMPIIRVPEVVSDKPVSVRVWSDQCEAYNCGKDVALWLSEFMKLTCRLVYFPENGNRLVDQDYAKLGDYTAFSDGFPILMISQASLDDLNARLETPVPMTRFRPNLVVSGCGAFAEDSWKIIKAGELILRVVKPCSRCVIPSIDTQTGAKGKEPLATLSQYRKQNNRVLFGQNVIANSVGKLETGMSVEVLEWV